MIRHEPAMPHEVPSRRAAHDTSGCFLELSDIAKVHATESVETLALREVHLEVKRGEWVAIVGPSGSGKSTLLSILGLLDTPTRGSYRLGGVATETLTARERARLRNRSIGFIFQTFNLIGELSVEDNVGLPLGYRGMPGRERKELVREALAAVDMSHRLAHYPAQLSGGQQQRVAVARAIVGKPELLLADEPTGNLDSANGAAVMELLAQLHAAGSTLCMVTHDASFAKRATRIASVFDGRVVEERRTS
jgi:putative ABC transport system ATP-binding protein